MADKLRPRLRRKFETALREGSESIEARRLKTLCRSFARVAQAQDLEMIVEVISWPHRFDSYNRVDTVEALYSRGLTLTFEQVERACSNIWTAAMSETWLDDNERYLVIHALAALAFTDAPQRATPLYTSMLERLRGHEIRALVTAVLDSGFDGSIVVARSLDAKISPQQPSSDFLHSVLRKADKEQAEKYFIDELLGDKSFALPRAVTIADEDRLVKILSALIEDSEAVRLSLVQAAEADSRKKTQIAFVLASSGINGLEYALRLMSDSAQKPIPKGLWEAIRKRWLFDFIPDGSGNVYYSKSKSAAKLRSNLLEIAISDSSRKRAALQLLGWIDLERAAHGNIEEERHPDLKADVCWPSIDWQLNTALASFFDKASI